MKRIVNSELLKSELVFTTSRSGGPGGQNVNKVNSKVSLKFDIPGSTILTDEEKEILLAKLSSRITVDGSLQIIAQEKRSQLQNKELAMEKLDTLFRKAFTKKKVRKATKPTKAAKEKRIKEKKIKADRKKWRQKPE